MTIKPQPQTLTLLGSLVLVQAIWLHQAANAQEVINRAKLATVLVDRGALGSGSGFCVSTKGLFVTNAHVVQGLRPGQSVRLVLSPSTADERTLDARLLSLDEEQDLALLQAEGATRLTALQVGGAQNLTETQSLTVLGYPFGRLLAYGGGYPSISVNVSRVSALRREDGELRAVQLDGAVNPGNSGGPVINEAGQVVSVIVSAIPGSGVSFSIPSTTVEAFLNKPAVVMNLPDVRYVDRRKPIDFAFESIAFDSSVQPNTFELTLDSGNGEGKPIKLTMADLKRKKKVKLIDAADDAAESVLLIVRRGPETVYVPTTNHAVQVGAKTFSLLEVRKIDSRPEGTVVMTAEGKKYLGAISGWTDDEAARSRGLLAAADRIDVYSLDPLEREVRCTLVALRAGKEVARVEELLKFSGAPQVLKKDIVEKYLQQTGQGTSDDPLAELRAKVEASRDTAETVVQWDARRAAGPTQWTVLEATSLTAAENDKSSEYKFERMPDGSYFVTGPELHVKYIFRARTPFPVSNVTAIRLETILDDRLPNGGAGRASNGNCVISTLRALAIGGGGPSVLAPARVTADHFQWESYGDPYAPARMFDTDNRTGWAIGRDTEHPHQAVVEIVSPADLDPASAELEIHVDQLYDDAHSLGRFRLSVTDAPRPVIIEKLPEAVTAIVDATPEKRTPAQQAELLKFLNDSNLILRRVEQQFQEGLAAGGDFAKLEELRTKLEEARDTPEQVQRWEEQRARGLPQWTVLEATSLTAVDTMKPAEYGFERMPDGSYYVTGPREKVTYVFRSGLPFDASKLTAIRLEAIPDERLPRKGSGRDREGNFVLTGLEPFARNEKQRRGLRVARATADWFQTSGRRDGYPPTAIFAGEEGWGWAIWRDVQTPHELVIEVAPGEGLEAFNELELGLTCDHSDIHILGRFRVSVTDSPRPVVVDDLPEAPAAIVKTPRSQRSEAQQEELLDWFNESNVIVRRSERELTELASAGSMKMVLLRQQLEDAREIPERIADWESRRAEGLPKWTVVEATSLTADVAKQASAIKFERQDDGSYFVSGPSDKVVYVFRCPLPFAAQALSGIRIEALPDARLPSNGPGRYSNGNFVMEGMEASLIMGERGEPLTVTRATADFFQTFGTPGGYPPTHVFDGNEMTGWAVEGGIGAPHTLTAEIAPATMEDGTGVELQIKLQFRWDFVHSIGRFRIGVTDAPRPVVVDQLPAAIHAIVHTARDRRTAEQQAELLKYFADSNVLVPKLESELAEAATSNVFPLEAFLDRTDPYAAPLDSFEIEAAIDGSSSLWVTRYGLMWHHHKARKPGMDTPSGKMVKVNGAPWYLAWINNSGAVEGEDQTGLFRLPLGPGIWDFEVLSATSAATGLPDPGRYAVDQDIMDDHTEMDLDDNGEGAGMYRVRFTRRK